MLMNEKTINDLTEYFLNNNFSNLTVFEIFNNWRDKYKYSASTYEEAIWIIEYIKMMLETDRETIKEALEIDAKLFKGVN
jgi:hypothetical protein